MIKIKHACSLLWAFCILGCFVSCADDEADETNLFPNSSLRAEKYEASNRDLIYEAAAADAYISEMHQEKDVYTVYFSNSKRVTLWKNRTPVLQVDTLGRWVVNDSATVLKADDRKGHAPAVTIGDNGNWWIDGKDCGIATSLKELPGITAFVDKGDVAAFTFPYDTCVWIKKQLEAPYIDNHPLPLDCDTLRVLALGNSYTLDAIAYLHEMVRASGIDLKRLVVYVGVSGGASLQFWHKKLMSDDTISLGRAAGDLTMKNRGTLKDLLAQDWNVVCLQQNSAFAPDYSSFNPYLHALIDQIKVHCLDKNVAFAWQMVWSYWKGYEGAKFLPNRYELICDAAREQKIRDGIDILIPIGTTIENARNTSLQTPHDLTRDGTHIAFGVGRYLAAATWFQSILAPVFGKDITENPFLYEVTDVEKKMSKYETLSVTADNRWACHRCVMEACRHPFKMTPIDEISGIAPPRVD